MDELQAAIEWSGFVPEIIVGIILIGFARSFGNWSQSIKESSVKILDKLEKLVVELHQLRIDYERKTTKLDTEVNELHRRLDRAGINHKIERDD